MASSPKGLSLTDRFAMIRDAGFQGVELNLPDDEWSPDTINAAREKTGLEVAGIICTTHWKDPLSSPDASKRERTVRSLQMALRQAGEIGCNRVLLVPGTVTQEVSYDDCWKRSIEGIKRCTDDAEKAKCVIAIENVWNQFIFDPLAAVRFLDEINHPWVKWHFDIGNCVNYGWPEQWVRILGKRIANLHIKEYSRKQRDEKGPYAGFKVELGEGDIKWPDVMTALDEIGYEGYGILEVGGGDITRLKFLSERTDKLFGR